jgi:short-subunit dehydrogenase
VHGVRAALEHFRPQGSGVIVNNASMLGALGQAYAGVYVMTKFAVRGLSTSLRQELALDGATGIHVATVLPATIDTPIFRHGANVTGREVRPAPPVYPPEKVAKAIVRAATRPRREVYVGFLGWQLVQVAKVAPGTAERVMAVVADQGQLSATEPAEPTSGNLSEPSIGHEVTGGWHGRRRLAVRTAAAATAVAGGAAVALAARSRRG